MKTTACLIIINYYKYPLCKNTIDNDFILFGQICRSPKSINLNY